MAVPPLSCRSILRATKARINKKINKLDFEKN